MKKYASVTRRVMVFFLVLSTAFIGILDANCIAYAEDNLALTELKDNLALPELNDDTTLADPKDDPALTGLKDDLALTGLKDNLALTELSVEDVQGNKLNQENIVSLEEGVKDINSVKGSSENTEGYTLAFDLERPGLTVYDNPMARYFNYWREVQDQDVVNLDEWALKDFKVQFNLHLEGQDQPLVSYMSYHAASYSWEGTIHFDSIAIPYAEVVIEYYEDENGGYIEPYLLTYDLYLKVRDGRMVLSIPKLEPTNKDPGPDGLAKVLKIKNLEVKEANPPLRAIFVNGVAGDDNQDGASVETAVRTFARAKELATEHETVKEIIVVNTLTVSGDLSLAGTNAVIKRYEGFKGYLMRVNSGESASLSYITLDGNSAQAQAEKSLIQLSSDSTLNIQEGAILQNNQIIAIRNTATEGGAIQAQSATINMTGGSINNNQAVYGGGIYLAHSTLNFSGGEVSDNLAPLCIDNGLTPTQYYSAGGGILAAKGSSIYMSGEARVSGNQAAEIGGGISLGNQEWDPGNKLVMTGGVVDGNMSGATGGGIFIQAQYFNSGVSKAYISGGQITNNRMTGKGVTGKEFGGGGIYVNGAVDIKEYSITGTANGELYLTNAIITNNSSAYAGAGYASCPISKTTIHVTDGVAIYDNHTNSQGREIYVLCAFPYGLHGGNPTYKLSQRMLGGVPSNWRDSNNEGQFLAPDQYEGILMNSGDELALYTDEKGNELTQAWATVLIAGNSSSTRGGGIGSNGTVFFGKEENLIKIEVTKKWADPQQILDQVTVYLKANGAVMDSAVLSADNNWTFTFENLPLTNQGSLIEYTVEEETLRGFASQVEADGLGGFIITNSPVSPPTEPSEPSEPSQPSQPSQPTEPTEPSEPSQPTQPSQPSQPTQPTQPTDSTWPSEPTQATEPREPSPPTPPNQVTSSGPPPIRVQSYVQLPHTGSAEASGVRIFSLASSLAGAFLIWLWPKIKKSF